MSVNIWVIWNLVTWRPEKTEKTGKQIISWTLTCKTYLLALIIPSHNPQIDLILAVLPQNLLIMPYPGPGLSVWSLEKIQIERMKYCCLYFHLFPSILSLHSQSRVRQWTSNLTNEATDVSTRAVWSVSTYSSVQPEQCKVGRDWRDRKGLHN